MSIPIRLIDICDANGVIIEHRWLALAEPTHRLLRPNLPLQYVERLGRIFSLGARMTVAVHNEQVVGVAVWRYFDNTHNGIKFYVDDLVTAETSRSQGIGKALIACMEEKARQAGAIDLVLDSGVQRHSAHRFYFREGFSIVAHNFSKALV